MKSTKRLIVVDESPATRKALQYVAQMAAGRTHFRICLAHSLLAPPRQLVEYRGAEKVRLRAYKSRWISAREVTEQRALDRANVVLRQGGIARGAIEAHFCYLVDGTRATKKSWHWQGRGDATPWSLKKVALVAWGTYKYAPCGRASPPRQRIHHLGVE